MYETQWYSRTSSWRHNTWNHIPEANTKVFSLQHSPVHLTTVSHICMTSDSSHPLFCSVSYHRCGNFISLPCHSQDPAAAGLQILTTLFPENVYLSVSPESRFLSELSVWSMTRHTPVAVHLNLLHYLSLSFPLSFFLFLAHLLSPGWKSLCVQDEKVPVFSLQKPGVRRLAVEYTCNLGEMGWELLGDSVCCFEGGSSVSYPLDKTDYTLDTEIQWSFFLHRCE